MKKKIIVRIAVCAALVIIIAGAVYGVKIYQREQDPNWQIAKKLYNVESALQEIDESWELQSLTQVTPYCYQNPNGDTITYYCCITTYVDDESTGYFGLNQTALEQVVDMNALGSGHRRTGRADLSVLDDFANIQLCSGIHRRKYIGS